MREIRIRNPSLRGINLCRIPTEVRRCGCRRRAIHARSCFAWEKMGFSLILSGMNTKVHSFSNGNVGELDARRTASNSSRLAGSTTPGGSFCRCLNTLIPLSGPMEEETASVVPISLTVWSAWAQTHFLLNLLMATAVPPRSSTSAIPM